METRPLLDLIVRLGDFAAARDWDQYHSPKNLAMALVSEAGELAAEFQWLTESESATPDSERLERIRAEAADVFIYLLRLSDKLDFDLVAATHDKIAQNEQRYPAEKVRGSAKKYTEY